VRLNGIDFHVEVEGKGPPLLLLHGFTGSTRAWDAIRADLTSAATVIAVDLIGHGLTASPPDPSRYSFPHARQDLLALLDALQLERVDLLGYSMGGRVALDFTVHAPERVRGLVLESASPGIEDPDERKRRGASDNVLADRIQRDGVAAFVDEWERQPLLALAPHVSRQVRREQHRQRLANNALGLANSLRGMGAGQQEPLWSRLGELARMSVSLIVGELDARYSAVGARMQALVPSATLEVVSQAGHTAHLDQPAAFGALVKKLTQPNIRCYIAAERLF
jgi:2-succinyl-6-hydroxy-2,4-cyclohexadiene-1-carboxylate synthase